MHRSKNIIKRLALSRCPAPVMGKELAWEFMPGVQEFAQANLANCCRKLYTKLMGSGRDRLADVRLALISRRHSNHMDWVKLTCSLKDSPVKNPNAGSDYLCKPLRTCHDYTPCPIICNGRPYCSECFVMNEDNKEPNADGQISSPPIGSKPNNTDISFRGRNVRMQGLRITAKEVPKPL